MEPRSFVVPDIGTEEGQLRSQSLVKEWLAGRLTRVERLVAAPPSVIVLGYHRVSNAGTVLDVSVNVFVEQIEFLKNNVELVSLDAIVDVLRGRLVPSRPLVALTFDDGFSTVEELADPLLEKDRIPAALFVMAHPGRVNRRELNDIGRILSHEAVRGLQEKGWIIGCHSATHANLTRPEVSLDEEIVRAKETLEQAMGREIRYFAYPKGRCSAEVIRRTREAGFTAAFTARPGMISSRTESMKIPRVFPDGRHTGNQFAALFTHWGNLYLKTRELFRREL